MSCNSHSLRVQAGAFGLALDVGCGSGQGTLLLASRFQKVVGTDVSPAQVEEAQQAPHPDNVSFLACPAEELPVADGSVDVLTSFTAAHWFDIPRFMREAERVLAPSGCLVLTTNTLDMRLHFRDRDQELTRIFQEFRDLLTPYMSDKVRLVVGDYEEIFEAVPFPSKERITDIVDKVPMSVAELVGYVQSFSMFQAFLKDRPEEAQAQVQRLQERVLEAMGEASPEARLEFWNRQVCILASRGPVPDHDPRS
uniref:Methyltransferase type 11 domain-containing protein n=1 Tax=Anolis carolinensis TaxID=28377 RepID=A0A803TVU2_ANOCA|nr:PREDICTED: putative methyltransferase DDB_G0268948 [Anolis carolinensis]|eukprot:XP_008123599.1 PREDICTED: putative methyltransferase DDB_G0268948 [Anolis carolinensis]